MKRLIKILSAFMMIAVLVLNSSIACMGYDVLNCYANVPSMVEKGKGFTVNLQVQCNTSVSVVMFTVVHSDGIKYKGCSVNDGSNGYIEKSYSDNRLTVMYINTKGISVVEKRNLVDVKFEAEDYITSTDIQLCTSNVASSDELALECGEGKLYSVEIVEKAPNNKPSQSKAININNSPEKADKSVKSAVERSIPTQISSEEATDVANTEKSVVTVRKSNDLGLFMAGVSFAVAIVLLVLIGYIAGKKKVKIKSTTES